MTGQLLFMAAMGVLLGVCGGYPWGRILRRRERETAEDRGYNTARIELKIDREEAYHHGFLDGTAERRPDLPSPYHPVALPAGHDWREQVAAELAPEALALTNVPEPGTEYEGPMLERSLTSAGPGHPSPYAGVLTPAQRRRDKHKQRGQYAPAQGWSAPDADMLRETWKPEGAHWLADWQIEWHDSVAAVDEEIAEWVLRQRAWLAADRWDRGARRLGAVA